MTCSVKLCVGRIFSIDCLPEPCFHSSGGREPSGWNSGASRKALKRWSRRTRKNIASLIANSCPIHCGAADIRSALPYSQTQKQDRALTERGPWENGQYRNVLELIRSSVCLSNHRSGLNSFTSLPHMSARRWSQREIIITWVRGGRYSPSCSVGMARGMFKDIRVTRGAVGNSRSVSLSTARTAERRQEHHPACTELSRVRTIFEVFQARKSWGLSRPKLLHDFVTCSLAYVWMQCKEIHHECQ